MTEFILSHMNRNIQYDLFLLCLGIIFRLLSFQKRCRIRIEYNWKELWSTLTSLIKFIIGNESLFVKHQLDIFILCQHIINLFNLFIMCGDSFLANITYYDELYYEIIRTYSVFDNLNCLGKILICAHHNSNNVHKTLSTRQNLSFIIYILLSFSLNYYFIYFNYFNSFCCYLIL